MKTGFLVYGLILGRGATYLQLTTESLSRIAKLGIPNDILSRASSSPDCAGNGLWFYERPLTGVKTTHEREPANTNPLGTQNTIY